MGSCFVEPEEEGKREMRVRMPAEWEPDERNWMAGPWAAYAMGDKGREASKWWTAWAGDVQAVAMFEPVTVLVDPAVESSVRNYVQVDAPHPITVLPLPLDDSWVRDTGPTFVISDGDNICWLEGGWIGPQWYGAASRGAVPLGWTFAPATAELMPTVLHYAHVERPAQAWSYPT